MPKWRRLVELSFNCSASGPGGLKEQEEDIAFPASVVLPQTANGELAVLEVDDLGFQNHQVAERLSLRPCFDAPQRRTSDESAA